MSGQAQNNNIAIVMMMMMMVVVLVLVMMTVMMMMMMMMMLFSNQAGLENQMTRSKQVTNFVSLCREILMVFIETHFPTKIESQVSFCRYLKCMHASIQENAQGAYA